MTARDHSDMGPGAEFDLIRSLTRDVGGGPGIVEGPGDDAAVLEGGWVVTCDLTVEDVHFRRGWLSPAEAGGRAVRAAVSDLAAMAASPVAVLLALGGTPEDHASGLLLQVGQGARQAAEELGAPLVGGDVTRSPGPLVMDVIALGRTPQPVLRRGARPGDHLWVTGHLGGAAAATALLETGAEPGPALRRRFARPEPRLAAARTLAATGAVHALLDLSDGLAGDAGHLAAASAVGLVVDIPALPLDPAAVAALGRERATELALHGGEDYELLMAADPSLAPRATELAEALGVSLTRVGRVVEGRGVRLRAADGTERDTGGGWDHFAGPGREPGP